MDSQLHGDTTLSDTVTVATAPPVKRSSADASGDADEAVVSSGSYPTVGPDAVPGSGSGFEALVARFLADAGGVTPDQCVLAVCGPVTDGAACELPALSRPPHPIRSAATV